MLDDAGVTGGATSRRVLLIGMGTAAAAVVAGCATYGDTGGTQNPGSGGAGDPGSGARPDDAGDPEQSAGGAADGQSLAQTSDVPVGGEFINDHKNVVITQP